jgi:hypothetical protein
MQTLLMIYPRLNLFIQHQKDLDMVTQLMDRVEQDFDSPGKPLHVADPSRSMFCIMTVHDFDKMLDTEVQELHGHHHLLITGYPQASFGFDAKGMETLAPTSKVFTVQGV